MSKIVLICGPDRCGKTSIIDSLRKNVLVSPKRITIHSSTPPVFDEGSYDDQYWAELHYSNWVNVVINLHKADIHVILDRGHLGEHVYGTLYRNINTDFIFSDIDIAFKDNPNVYLVLLTDSIENRVSRDDNLSMTKNSQKMQQEHDLFVDAFNKSCIMNKMHLHKMDIVKMKNSVNSFIRGK